MQKSGSDPAALLDILYGGIVDPSCWPRFLTGLAGMFDGGTASFRVTSPDGVSIYESRTVGFNSHAEATYVRELVCADPFRQHLSASPSGLVHASHRIVGDREYARSPHYHYVFRPNGNFYAMGGQVVRERSRAAHIGVHRPRDRGGFTAEECSRLAFFYPHLRRVASLTRLLDQFDQALHHSRAALDCLPFGVWLTDYRLHWSWMNGVAEEALRGGSSGLGSCHGRLVLTGNGDGSKRLQAALRAINREQSQVEIVRLGAQGACLVLMADHQSQRSPWVDGEAGVLVFLLEPGRPVAVDAAVLRELYGLTPAESGVAGLFLQGLALEEICATLGVSPHTGRTHLKSIMYKTGVSRQPELMRQLLLGVGVVQSAPGCRPREV